MPRYYPPTGTGRRTGKRAQESEHADRTFMLGLYAWWDALPAVEQSDRAHAEEYAAAERRRLELLAGDRALYEGQCAQRDAEAARQNAELDALISGFTAGEESAVAEYFAIVLGNSAYPDGFDVDYDLRVNGPNRELSVDLHIPGPDDLPIEKAYKYTKARDEIAPVNQTQSERKQRYNAVVNNVAMRTIHELWEADRTGKLDTISLTAGVAHIDPATGRETTTTLLAVAVARDEFEALVLDRVDAGASLQHLGAVVSRSPAALTPIGTSAGVRTR